MVTHSAKVFGYVDRSVKERIAKLREVNGRRTRSIPGQFVRCANHTVGV